MNLLKRSYSYLGAMIIASSLLVSIAFAQEQYMLSDEDEWELTQKFDPKSPEGQLAEAKRVLAADQPDRANILADLWIEEYPHHPLLPEAYLLRGDSLLAQGEEYKALFDYELVARQYAGSQAFVDALMRELEIAKKYADGYKRKLWGLRIAPAEDEAEELFIRVQERLSGSKLAEEAGMELADFYFERQQMELAVDAYDLFITNYPQSIHVNKARRRLIFSELASFKGPEFDPVGLHEARIRLKNFQLVAPIEADRVGAEALLIRIDESNAAKMLTTARWYLRIGDPVAAELMIRRLIKQYPRTVATADALRLIPSILPKLPPETLKQAPDYESLRTVNAHQVGSPPVEEIN